MYDVFVIKTGCYVNVGEDYAQTCTCTLIKGKKNVIVNTLSPWDYSTVLAGIKKYGLEKNDIDFVVSTHARADYCGNNHLFKNSIHIVGHSITRKNVYYRSPFIIGDAYYIDGEDLKIIPTPGYTLTDVTVVVKTDLGQYFITGELFQDSATFFKREDWEGNVFSTRRRIEYPMYWRFNRNMVMESADYIVPGHGDIIKVTQKMRDKFFNTDDKLDRQRMRRKDNNKK